jgi:hypothetical protein
MLAFQERNQHHFEAFKYIHHCISTNDSYIQSPYKMRSSARKRLSFLNGLSLHTDRICNLRYLIIIS